MILRVKTTEDWNRLEIVEHEGISTLWMEGILLGYIKKKVFLKSGKETCIQYSPVPQKTICQEPLEMYKGAMLLIAILNLEGYTYKKTFVLRKDGKVETYEEGNRVEELFMKQGEPISYIYWEGNKPFRYESDGMVCQIMIPRCCK